MTPSAGLMNGLGLGSLMTMIWRNGRDGLALPGRWHMTCSCTTMAAGRLWATASMPSACSMRMRRGSRPNGATRFLRRGGWHCGLGRMAREPARAVWQLNPGRWARVSRPRPRLDRRSCWVRVSRPRPRVDRRSHLDSLVDPRLTAHQQFPAIEKLTHTARMSG